MPTADWFNPSLELLATHLGSVVYYWVSTIGTRPAQRVGGDPQDLLGHARDAFTGEQLTHHEKWDGSGYPARLCGEAIPIAGRIVAIADVFDALSCRRPYKEPRPVEQTLGYLKEPAGKHFDPTLIDLFLELLPQVRAVMQKWQDQ
ncbi:HD domain-containing phosphohydrolase [uncultured Thiodictyon sp.]|uniref:HD-GYP domain-containing protein n=1 Tax=uncultured Thiodictyon sp. TaxID=1846217 RepID=UPI0025D4E694|nr:HD domain-containing phosphohydrolase [uncultured Thiodictyon sp.]